MRNSKKKPKEKGNDNMKKMALGEDRKRKIG